MSNYAVCSRIGEIVDLILINERVIDSLYFEDEMSSFIDFFSINKLEIENRLLREELNKLVI